MLNTKFASVLTALVLSSGIAGAPAAIAIEEAPQQEAATWTVDWLMAEELSSYAEEQLQATPGFEGFFPQTRTTLETAPCERWIRRDVYNSDDEKPGDTLEWVDGGPEDKGMYISHEFIWTGSCDEEVEVLDTVDICVWDGKTATVESIPATELTEDDVLHSDGSECTPEAEEVDVVLDAGPLPEEVDVVLSAPAVPVEAEATYAG